MGHHIDAQGHFQSDRHPELAPDKIILSFKDPRARLALEVLAVAYADKDPELTADIRERLRAIEAAEHAAPAEKKCKRCDGCGRIANSEDGEPWTVWERLPPGSDLAVRAGIVKPIECPDCGGAGKRLG